MIEVKASTSAKYLFNGRMDVITRVSNFVEDRAAQMLGLVKGDVGLPRLMVSLPDSFGFVNKFAESLCKYVSEIIPPSTANKLPSVKFSPAIQELKDESAKYPDGGQFEVIARFEPDHCVEVVFHIIEKVSE